jgi:MFS-type transporter involved in bile tolerance (Atg22 family)
LARPSAVLGGFLTERFGWPAVFWINPPLAVIAIALLLRFAPGDRPELRRFDVAGAAIIACGLAALAFALSRIGLAESAAAAATPIALLPSVSPASPAIRCGSERPITR